MAGKDSIFMLRGPVVALSLGGWAGGGGFQRGKSHMAELFNGNLCSWDFCR